MNKPQICNFGALKSKTDIRDYSYKAGVVSLPETYECKNMPKVKNQQSVNSCVAHTSSTILEWFNTEEDGRYVRISTDFIYGMQAYLNPPHNSHGMYLRDACKIAQKYGSPQESLISGNTEMPKAAEKLKEKIPNLENATIDDSSILADAYYYSIESYARCRTANDMKLAIKNNGPLLASVKWYDTTKYYKDTKSLTYTRDNPGEYGYHAITVYGWNARGWLCQNSWGTSFGDKGRFILPYDYKVEECWTFVDAMMGDYEHLVEPKFNIKWVINIINRVINFFKDYFGS